MSATKEMATGAHEKALSDSSIEELDTFYYLFQPLHSQEYRNRIETDLKKEHSHVPQAQDFCTFAQSGRELGRLRTPAKRDLGARPTPPPESVAVR